MRIIADTHTHTLASGHAFSTITENAAQAKKMGLDYLFMCEHTKAMIGAAPDVFFESALCSLPQEIGGVAIVRGCEANVMDSTGRLDMEQGLLARLEWVIASMHPLVVSPMSKAECTRAWRAIAENPHVDVLGHCGDGRYPFDHEEVVKACARTGTLIEINNHSFSSRPGSPENCADIAGLCIKYGTRVTVSSDAHFWTQIGVFDQALAMLARIQFPQELVVNADRLRLAKVLEDKAKAG